MKKSTAPEYSGQCSFELENRKKNGSRSGCRIYSLSPLLLYHTMHVFKYILEIFKKIIQTESGGSGETFPAQSIELFHYFADFFLHALAGFALSGEPHEADLGLSFAEIDLPFLLFILCYTNAVFVVAALHFI